MTVQHRVNVIRPTFIGLNMKFPVHKSLQNTTGNAGFSTTAICTCNQNSRHRFHIFHILIHLHITFPRLFTFFILERVRSVDKNHLNPCLPAGFHFHINATRFSTVFRNKYFCLCFPNKPHIILNCKRRHFPENMPL